MIFFEEHLWGTASAITKNIYLTKDWNKKKVFDQSTNSGL